MNTEVNNKDLNNNENNFIVTKKERLTKRNNSDIVKESIEQVKTIRARRRSPLSEQRRLVSIKIDKNFVYRLVTDNGTRISQFEDAGWFIVDKTGEEIHPDKRIQDPSWQSSSITQVVGHKNGKAEIGYMMRIPRELYNEDIKRQQEIISNDEKSLLSSKVKGKNGEVVNDSYVKEVKIDHS